MSLLTSQKPLDLDLVQGFSWYAVIKVDLEKSAGPGRKIIAQWLDLASGVSLSFGLDDVCHLRLWLVDKNGKKHVSVGIGPGALNAWVLLACEIAAIDVHSSRIAIEINLKDRVESEVPAAISGKGSFYFSIGADAGGGEQAVFSLAEMFIVNGVADAKKKTQLWRYAENKYALKREP